MASREKPALEPLAGGHGHALETILIESVRHALAEAPERSGEALVIGGGERALGARAREPDRIRRAPEEDHARPHPRGPVTSLHGERGGAELEVHRGELARAPGELVVEEIDPPSRLRHEQIDRAPE